MADGAVAHRPVADRAVVDGPVVDGTVRPVRWSLSAHAQRLLTLALAGLVIAIDRKSVV